MFMQRQVRPPWGRLRILPEPGPTRAPGPLFSLKGSPMTTPVPTSPPLADMQCQAQGLQLGGGPPAHSSFPHTHTHSLTRLQDLHSRPALSAQPHFLPRQGPGAQHGLVCTLKITVSEVMNGKAFALLFLPERRGLNHVGE